MDCKECQNAIKPGWPHYAKDGHCVKCGIWLDNLRKIQAEPDRHYVIDGCAYADGGRTSGKYRGFGGRRFLIARNNRIHVSCDLWRLGDVPEWFRGRLPDDAKWADGHEQRWVEMPDGTKALDRVMQAEWPIEITTEFAAGERENK